MSNIIVDRNGKKWEVVRFVLGNPPLYTLYPYVEKERPQVESLAFWCRKTLKEEEFRQQHMKMLEELGVGK